MLIRKIPVPGESFEQFVLSLATANAVTVRQLEMSRRMQKMAGTAFTYCNFTNDALLSPQHARRMILGCFDDAGGKANIPAKAMGYFQPHRRRYCPLCVTTRGHRLLWNMRLVTTCPDHAVLLRAGCPHCVPLPLLASDDAVRAEEPGLLHQWLRLLDVLIMGERPDAVHGFPVVCSVTEWHEYTLLALCVTARAMHVLRLTDDRLQLGLGELHALLANSVPLLVNWPTVFLEHVRPICPDSLRLSCLATEACRHMQRRWQIGLPESVRVGTLFQQYGRLNWHSEPRRKLWALFHKPEEIGRIWGHLCGAVDGCTCANASADSV